MTGADILAQLDAHSVELWLEGGTLRFRAPKGALTPEIRASLAENREAVIDAVRERDRRSSKNLPPSQNQLGMWLVHQVAPNSAAYNVSFSIRIWSQVNTIALQRVFQALLDRHAALRTTFVLKDGQPFQHIPGYCDVDFAQIDVPGLDEDALYQQVYASYQQPFDLEKGPIMRVRLFTRGPEDHVLLLVIHHIATDGWSMWTILQEITTLYAAYQKGEPISLPHPEAQYSDFSQWQAEIVAGDEGERLWSYWKEQLAGELTPLDLPTDHPRSLVTRQEGHSELFELDEEITHGLKALAKDANVTLYMVLLTAFQVLLHRYTAQDDIIVGTPAFGRSRPEYANVVGDFVNMMPMRVHLQGNPTFRECIAQVRRVVLSAIDHQDFPFALMVERLGPRTHMDRSPLFQATFDMQRIRHAEALSEPLSHLFAPRKSLARTHLSGMEIEVYPLPQQEGQFDLVMQILDADPTLPGVLKYSSDLYDHATIARLLRHFEKLLHGIIANPNQRILDLPLLTETERAQMLSAWNDTNVVFPADTGIHHLFEQQAALQPEAVAAVHEGQSVTYGELNARANQLAHHLHSLQIQPDTTVGVYIERGLDMLVILLGILKSGAAYVPMDPAFPRQRLTYMIEDAGMPVIVTHSQLVDQLPPHQAQLICIDRDWPLIQQQPSQNPTTVANGKNLAYVIFTSGSTGRPKGVQIEHHSLTNFLLSMRAKPGLCADDVVLALTTLSFDIAALELYLPLTVGARVIVLSREASWDGRRLASALAQHNVTVMQATPAGWELLLESGWEGKRDLKMLCGGEPLSSILAERLLQRGAALWNLYGPTETTVWSTVEQITSTTPVITIGRPIANTTVFVLDKQLQPVPIGVAGTLYIGGAGVGRGYIGRDDLTAERFIANPFGPGRIYNTGDLARWLPDGRLECLGRVDHQVKVRGFRIELGEIESALESHDSVQRAVVVVHEAHPGDKRLVAYVVPSHVDKLEGNALRDYLSMRLPSYMVPSSVVMLEALPLTPNGKVDRRALPAPVVTEQPTKQRSAEVKTPAEAFLVTIWQGVLGVDRISIYDNFFDLGGHSLQVVQVVSKVENETGIYLEPAYMRFQSLKQQAAAIESAELFQTASPSIPVVAQDSYLPRRLETPLFFGPQDELYGMYYPAEVRAQLGVVVCHAWGPEYLRTHRACHQLALRLSSVGIPTLRFDYYGTGDSAGDDLDMSLRRSLDDIATAINELRRHSGVSQVAFVGLRLGATFAALAALQLQNIRQLVLWEPIVNGRTYLEELELWHRSNLHYFLGKVTARHSAQTEVLGFALSDQAHDEIQAIDLLTLDGKFADDVLIIEREAIASTEHLCRHLEAQDTAIVYKQIDAPILWTENVDKALVPHQTLEAIVEWIKKEAENDARRSSSIRQERLLSGYHHPAG